MSINGIKNTQEKFLLKKKDFWVCPEMNHAKVDIKLPLHTAQDNFGFLSLGTTVWRFLGVTEMIVTLLHTWAHLNSLCSLPFLRGGTNKEIPWVDSFCPKTGKCLLLTWCLFFRAVNNGTIQGWANRYMSLSEEVRNMIFGDDGATEDPQSVESYAAWGVEAFTSGRHYWEVDVAKASNWVLGVCKDSMTSGNYEGERAFLLFSLKKNNHCSLSTNSPPVTHFVQRPQGRVGVFLDYDNATMSFYDVCRGSLICTFFSSPFTSPLKPFLCLSSP